MYFVTKLAKIYKLLSRQNSFLNLQVWKSGLGIQAPIQGGGLAGPGPLLLHQKKKREREEIERKGKERKEKGKDKET